MDEVRSGTVKMTLAGSVLLDEPARRYDARLFGTLEYDTKAKAFTRFDVTSVGDWTWPEAEGKPTHTFGVTIELWTRPFASPLYDRFFPGFSMQHYGYDEKKE